MIKRITIEIKDEGSVVCCYRKPTASQKKKDVYVSEYDNMTEFAFSNASEAVAKVEELLGEIK